MIYSTDSLHRESKILFRKFLYIPDPHFTPINQDLKFIVDDAKRFGYIQLDHLYSVLAHEKECTSYIQKLWDKYRLITRKGAHPFIRHERKNAFYLNKMTENNEASRKLAWWNLFQVFIFENLSGAGFALPDQKKYKSPLYVFDSESKKYKECVRDQCPYDSSYVKLQDLKDYFSNVLQIPFSALLYDKEKDESKSDFLTNRKESSECQYAFKKTGPTWSITYEGKVLSGLKGNGFEHIHYLIQHPRKVYTTNELAGINATPTGNAKRETNNKIDGYRKSRRNDSVSGIGDKQNRKLKEEWNRLAQEVREAENSKDQYRIQQANEELKKFKKLAADFLKPNGKLARSEDVKIRDRITKAISRAINSLKTNDENTYMHFKKSLSPIKSFILSYNPDREINWLTE